MFRESLAIESIAEGDCLPRTITLWIDDQIILDNMPLSLKRLEGRGLTVRKCENFGPHTKYYGYLESESYFVFPLVTADDDAIYPTDWLSKLIRSYNRFPSFINCHRARKIEIIDGEIQSYNKWLFCSNDDPSFLNIALGIGGVIYPPVFLSQLKEAGRGFIESCPKQDDLWLHVNAIRNGWKIKQIETRSLYVRETPGSQARALWHENLLAGENDMRISLLYSDRDISILNSAM